MHEVGLLHHVIELASEAASRENATRIVRLKIQVGKLAGVVPEAMAFAFEVVSKGTIAEGSTFEWDEVPIRCACASGCPDFWPEGLAVFLCPNCGEVSGQVLEGRELNLMEIEIE